MGAINRGVRLALAAAGLLAAGPASAQRGAMDWMTAGADSQRSSWIRIDPKISPDTLSRAGFQLLWKLAVQEDARHLSSLTPPALFDFYIGYRGFRSLGFVGGSSDSVAAIDVDLGLLEWSKSLTPGSAAAGTLACPGGMTSTVTRPTLSAYPSPGARTAGRSGPARSGVGEAHEGAVTLRDRPPPPAPPPAPVPGQRVAPPVNPYVPRTQLVHALTSDGKLHSLYVSNGEEPNPPVPFLPPGAHALGLVVFGGTAYAATVNACPGVDDGVWALDLESGRVVTWKSPSAPAGSSGFAVGPDGTLFVATRAGDLAALEPGTLAVKGVHKAGSGFTSSPLVFDHKGKDFLAVSSADGRIHLFDAAAPGPPLATTPVLSGPGFDVGALASWQDAGGRRWLLAPAGGAAGAPPAAGTPGGETAGGAVVAFEIAEDGGTLSLRSAWRSRELVSPLPPVVVNGVVFALSSGSFRSSDAGITVEERARRSSPAVLYALDGLTGKELWTSGASIASFVGSGGLAAGGGRVYVGDHEGTEYAFGFPMER